jgi:uncharacterized membrane protein SirB2
MIEYYLQIKVVHMACVLASAGLFMVRGFAAQLGARWPLAWPPRYLSYAIDATLLTSAMMLSTMLRQYPFVHSWLTAKVTLLLVYIVLGNLALKRARSPRVRRMCFIAALAIYGVIFAIARSHDALGPVRWFFSYFRSV